MQEMSEVRAEVSAEDVDQLKLRFKRWRESRKLGEHIPAILWSAAVELARRHDPLRVAHELRIDYEGLKRRLDRTAGGAALGRLDPQFVELFATAPMPASIGQCECVVEMHNARGAKMRVELNGNGLAGLAGLCNAFLGAA